MFIDSIDSLAILLGNREVAANLLAKYSLQGLRDVTTEQLQQVQGVGSGRAVRLQAALRLAGCLSKYPAAQGILLDSPSAVFETIGGYFAGEQKEHFLTLL